MKGEIILKALKTFSNYYAAISGCKNDNIPFTK